MHKIVVDPDMRAKLTSEKGNAELTDDTGNVLGYFLSEDSFDRIVAVVLPEPTKEDLVEARKEMLEKGGVTTAEILESMRAAEREWKSR